ncbi:MAG TPA: 2,3,4,5-tetrahydropyridine-2,6-dicarboxylate N-acetyltransferase [bacterium]|nr:2,3,4,5-tetrahydropyridine-2,6-dicarboxylate N-acetyltransferase [bacterium]
MDAYDIIKYISESEKQTPARVYLKGEIEGLDLSMFKEVYRGVDHVLVIDQWTKIEIFLKMHHENVHAARIDIDRRNSAVPLLDIKGINARIEPGAIIRDKVLIGDKCVIMMGAVINIGSEIGEGTMIDMNVVVGGRVIVGKHCHIGAGSVLAGVVEPPSAEPVRIGDNVVMGANAVVLEGVQVGEGAVVAAGAVVTQNVEPYTVVAGVPARVIKKVDDKTKSKTELVEALRNL